MARSITYAIGDIHGMLAQLQLLYAVIREDAARHSAQQRIIHLGDYLDRGPDSAGVIIAVMAMEAEGRTFGFEVISLRGNHEQMLLDAYNNPDPARFRTWCYNGGDIALGSYARRAHKTAAAIGDDWKKLIPHDHLAWLAALPTRHIDTANKWVFVHAGIDPQRYPECSEEVRIWTRSEMFFDFTNWPIRTPLKGLKVIHGHTPTDDFQADIHRHRINVDTGCVYGGVLSCVALEAGENPRILSVS
jgi:serine/threonine protein phosphatase 1